MLLAEQFLPESLSKSFFRVFLVRMRENMDQKKLRIWTLFTEYNPSSSYKWNGGRVAETMTITAELNKGESRWIKAGLSGKI